MKSQMYQKIEESTCHVASRKMVSNFAMKDENHLKEMIQLAFDTKDELHVKAFWSLDLVCEKKLKQFVPYIEDFCSVLPKINDDSALRPVTKIAFFLVKSNHRKNGISLTQQQEHNLIEALIDRLIQDEKVAAKVYAMKALFVLGKKYDWVHEELKTIIEQDYSNHSAAYQAATRNLLKKLNK
ncbi:hypothetical protein [Flavobacterium odoriferum]|uniref:hypothetical protein n=1 Tax=Flavobacterium odoriferum TaxID=2946604 RepID=UPI0021CB852D|nr:hypothetical protein [Flavobacterium sp. HXWNR29]